MKVKMISYYVSRNSQVFATFEYQRIKFDLFKNLEDHVPAWRFMEDDNFDKLNKLTNVELLNLNCLQHLRTLDNYLY